MARFQALDIIEDSKDKLFNIIIQQGQHNIDTDGCFRIDSQDCINQGAYSLVQGKYHPRTKEHVRKFFEHASAQYQPDENVFWDPTVDKTDLELKVIGFFELSFGVLAGAYNRGGCIKIYYYQIENGLHPCYQVSYAESLQWVSNYAHELRERLIKAGKIKDE